VSLGCESFNRHALEEQVRRTGRPVRTLVIQQAGGTRTTIQQGRQWLKHTLHEIQQTPRVEMSLDELIVGTICGGSDSTSGITANPVIGRAFDLLIEQGAACIFEETGELIGCEHHMAGRAATPQLGQQLIESVAKAERYYATLGHGSFAPGNAAGGLTTQEEKSLGAYAKSGTAPIIGLLKPGEAPPAGGLYLLDMVPDGPVRYGFPNINDNAEAVDLIACGCHLILFSTGRGSVVGSAVSPIIKICANPHTYRRLQEDMDINAGQILESSATIQTVANELFERIQRTADGEPTCSETLGHQEFILGYKSFEPLGPGCLPAIGQPTASHPEVLS